MKIMIAEYRKNINEKQNILEYNSGKGNKRPQNLKALEHLIVSTNKDIISNNSQSLFQNKTKLKNENKNCSIFPC